MFHGENVVLLVQSSETVAWCYGSGSIASKSASQLKKVQTTMNSNVYQESSVPIFNFRVYACSFLQGVHIFYKLVFHVMRLVALLPSCRHKEFMYWIGHHIHSTLVLLKLTGTLLSEDWRMFQTGRHFWCIFRKTTFFTLTSSEKGLCCAKNPTDIKAS